MQLQLEKLLEKSYYLHPNAKDAYKSYCCHTTLIRSRPFSMFMLCIELLWEDPLALPGPAGWLLLLDCTSYARYAWSWCGSVQAMLLWFRISCYALLQYFTLRLLCCWLSTWEATHHIHKSRMDSLGVTTNSKSLIMISAEAICMARSTQEVKDSLHNFDLARHLTSKSCSSSANAQPSSP